METTRPQKKHYDGILLFLLDGVQIPMLTGFTYESFLIYVVLTLVELEGTASKPFVDSSLSLGHSRPRNPGLGFSTAWDNPWTFRAMLPRCLQDVSHGFDPSSLRISVFFSFLDFPRFFLGDSADFLGFSYDFLVGSPTTWSPPGSAWAGWRSLGRWAAMGLFCFWFCFVPRYDSI